MAVIAGNVAALDNDEELEQHGTNQQTSKQNKREREDQGERRQQQQPPLFIFSSSLFGIAAACCFRRRMVDVFVCVVISVRTMMVQQNESLVPLLLPYIIILYSCQQMARQPRNREH